MITGPQREEQHNTDDLVPGPLLSFFLLLLVQNISPLWAWSEN